ncbi:MAG: cytidylate kinase family protein [Treponema sp.]|jgi:cytidylate kinase|nr:cytidylate kinase family protein [Treponema sp.]
MKKDIRIAVSGKSGCGNTTISKMVADRLGLRFINFTFRSLALEHGLDLKQVLALAAKDDFWDKEADRRQVQLARADGGCVLGSRLAIWMLEEADLKVYLRARPETRAQRIMQREGGSPEEVAAFTAERDRQDHSRYLRIYNIDNDKYEFANVVIDVDEITPARIADLIIQKAEEITNGH